MQEIEILELIDTVLVKRGKKPVGVDLSARLRDHGFRSMDFSEVALRIEERVGRELNFDANSMRAIQTFKDVVDFFHKSVNG